jgi:hypothetical protein
VFEDFKEEAFSAKQHRTPGILRRLGHEAA